MAWEILRSIAELVFGMGGLYALYQCMKSLRTMVGARRVEYVWRGFSVLMGWSVACCAALVVCALAGGRSIGVLVLAALMALMVVSAGLVLAFLRSKTLQQGGGRAVVAKDGELVEVRSLVSGRVRGRDESGGEVLFEPDDIKALVGVRGHVRMLNWASARKSGGQDSAITPLMAFWSEKGDAFVLYPDDEIVLANGAVH